MTSFKHLNKVIMREENKSTRNPGKRYISVAQRVELIHDVGDSAALLYHHYYDKAGFNGFDINNDEHTAKILGWSKRKVQRERLKLYGANWLFKKTYNGATGEHFYLTILGKTLVLAFLENGALNITEDTIKKIQQAAQENDMGDVFIQQKEKVCV